MRVRSTTGHDDGFTLIELLVVVVIIGILAGIAIPRFLDQQRTAFDATAVSDLRNLISVQTSLAAAGGPSETPAVVAAEGWTPTDAEVVACADLVGTDDIVLAVWHVRGSTLYQWQRSGGPITATALALPTTCNDAIPGGTPELLT